jgi:hypothetical protein
MTKFVTIGLLVVVSVTILSKREWGEWPAFAVQRPVESKKLLKVEKISFWPDGCIFRNRIDGESLLNAVFAGDYLAKQDQQKNGKRGEVFTD